MAERRGNIERLFAPRSVAFVGGRSAELAAGQCVAGGFEGSVWGVNPKRRSMAGQPCVAKVEDLPEAPDAVFLAVPSERAVASVDALRKRGVGGIVCYTAGFGEIGGAGARLERELVEAAGEVALVGPNCSGMLNYLHKAALWPFDHGGQPVERGAAFITQSGMLGNTVTMNRRSLPFAYIISSGNQAMLGVEDFLEVLIDDPAVDAVGLYIEGLRDVHRFAAAAIRALEAGKPIVAQKAGTSETGARLTVTHTGSLSGTDGLYDGLFRRLGIIRVESAVAMIETLKLITVAGIPKGRRVAGLTCSGGDSTMLADSGEPLGLTFPQPSDTVAAHLTDLLPPIATLSNPLDYTTPLWGQEEHLESVFDTLFEDSFDAAVMVQDYPALVGGESYEPYLADLRAFAKATRAAGIPGAVCSILPENLDEGVRLTMIEGGVAPLQGIDDALGAVAGAARFGELRKRMLRAGSLQDLDLLPYQDVDLASARDCDEWEGKERLASAGLRVPEGRVTDAKGAPEAAAALGFPVAIKLVSADLPHKTEAGALRLGVANAAEVEAAVGEIAAEAAPGHSDLRFLVERMVEPCVAELLVGVRHAPLFGPVMVVGSGGVLAELHRDTRVLLLPCNRDDIAGALRSLKLFPLLDGYRGRPAADLDAVVEAISIIARFARDNVGSLIELDVNPLIATPDGAFAADVLLRTVD